MTEAAIQIQGLRKVFAKGRDEVVAVDGLDLEVSRGEIFGLLGPNGAGKTTTVEICEGLQQPTAGEVRVLGLTWRGAGAAAIRQRIGVTLQDTRFFEKQSVREVLTLFRSFYDRGRTVDEVLALFALEEKARARTTDLSGGQRQRLAVACALVSDPELLFLDEPTTGLDPQSRRQLWRAVKAYQEGGGTVLMTTHYMEEAEQLCSRVGIVDHGRIMALDTPARLIASMGGDHVVEVVIDGPGAGPGGGPGGGQGLGGVPGDVPGDVPGGGVTSEEIAALPSVQTHALAAGRLSMTVAAPHLAVPGLLRLLAAKGLSMQGLATRHTSLEDVFVHLTGRHLRDGDRLAGEDPA